MKYYVYVSDTKVEMLYSQIPLSIREKLAIELKIDLKLLSATLKEKPDPSEATRYAKVALVADYISKHREVGSADAPRAYFRGSMPMKWALYEEFGNLVYLGA